MVTQRLSSLSAPPSPASQMIGLQASGRASTKALDNPAQQQMHAVKLTLPPRSQSVQVLTDAQQQMRFEEDHRRSTILQRVPHQESDDASAVDVQSSRSTVFERLSTAESDAEVPPGVKTLADRIADVKLKGLELKELAQNVEKAKSVNVDPAKRTFWQKLGGAVVSVGVVALFTALTVSTGGAAAIVGLSVAGIMLAKNAGDTYCAMKVLQNKRAEAKGDPPPHKNVPMGADWIGNMCHSALSSAHKDKIASGEMSADDIKGKAKSWSLGVNIALKVVSFSAGGVTGIASGAAWLPRVGSIAFSAATLAVTVCLDKVKENNAQWSKQYVDEKLPDHMMKLCDQYTELFTQADTLPPEQRDALFAKLDAGLSTLLQDLNQLESRLVKTHDNLSQPSSAVGEAVKGGVTEGLLFAGGVQVGRRALELTQAVKATGMNFESAASSILMFKTAYDCWSMMQDQSQRTKTLGAHAESILDIRNQINMASNVPPPGMLA